MVPTEITARVIVLVAKRAGLQPEDVRREHRLLHDLGIYGDDADDLLFAIADEFGLSVADLKDEQIFLTETSPYWLLPNALRRRLLAKVKPVTVDDLIQSAITGNWVFAANQKNQQ